jgi:hypothetical protein
MNSIFDGQIPTIFCGSVVMGVVWGIIWGLVDNPVVFLILVALVCLISWIVYTTKECD